jgi:hypothetical protein
MNEVQLMGDAECNLPQALFLPTEESKTEKTATQINTNATNLNIVIDRIVRNFDHLTESVLMSLYDFLMDFHDDETVKGDYHIEPTGSRVLLTEQMKINAITSLAQMAQMIPDLQQRINWDAIGKDYLRAIHLDPDKILLTPEQIQQNQEAQAQQLQAQQQTQSEAQDKQNQHDIDVINTKAQNSLIDKQVKHAHNKELESHKAVNEAMLSPTAPQQEQQGGEIEHRLFGGYVEPQKPYVVGEQGPEVVVPKTAGVVVPNPRTLIAASIQRGVSANQGNDRNYLPDNEPTSIGGVRG